MALSPVLRAAHLLEILRRAGYRVLLKDGAIDVTPVDERMVTLVRDLLENNDGLHDLLCMEEQIEAIRQRAMKGDGHDQELV